MPYPMMTDLNILFSLEHNMEIGESSLFRGGGVVGVQLRDNNSPMGAEPSGENPHRGRRRGQPAPMGAWGPGPLG